VACFKKRISFSSNSVHSKAPRRSEQTLKTWYDTTIFVRSYIIIILPNRLIQWHFRNRYAKYPQVLELGSRTGSDKWLGWSKQRLIKTDGVVELLPCSGIKFDSRFLPKITSAHPINYAFPNCSIMSFCPIGMTDSGMSSLIFWRMASVAAYNIANKLRSLLAFSSCLAKSLEKLKWRLPADYKKLPSSTILLSWPREFLFEIPFEWWIAGRNSRSYFRKWTAVIASSVSWCFW